ncbi:hypothetical protein [Pseudomonas sp. A-B-19]|uniref:hypothetical protein n=1 Tax=Pseudomonas sp. A-B-19 TaxID=2832405 RepID=UPI001CBE0DCF|nr:hypothetical protein [Pseudomonas sp. A-B-19]
MALIARDLPLDSKPPANMNTTALQAFLQILSNGFIQAFNARYERLKLYAG